MEFLKKKKNKRISLLLNIYIYPPISKDCPKILKWSPHATSSRIIFSRYPNNHYSKQRIQRIPTPSNHASTQTSPFISRATSDSNVSTPIRTKIYSIPMADLLDRLSSSGRRSSYCAAWINEARVFGGVRRTLERALVDIAPGTAQSTPRCRRDSVRCS